MRSLSGVAALLVRSSQGFESQPRLESPTNPFFSSSVIFFSFPSLPIYFLILFPLPCSNSRKPYPKLPLLLQSVNPSSTPLPYSGYLSRKPYPTRNCNPPHQLHQQQTLPQTLFFYPPSHFDCFSNKNLSRNVVLLQIRLRCQPPEPQTR